MNSSTVPFKETSGTVPPVNLTVTSSSASSNSSNLTVPLTIPPTLSSFSSSSSSIVSSSSSSSSSTSLPSPVPTYPIFCDLDGVLADFDTLALQILGYPFPSPNSGASREMMQQAWEPLSIYQHPLTRKGFYDSLQWMPDGKALWSFIKVYAPIILTGLPRGSWARPQKLRWCRSELGKEYYVITCNSKDKAQEAVKYIKQEQQRNRNRNSDQGIGILIDDRADAGIPWKAAGGIFIHHTTTVNTLLQLKQLGYP